MFSIGLRCNFINISNIVNKMSGTADKDEVVRTFYIDWLKAAAVHLVVFLHCVYSADEVFEQSKRFNSFAEHKNSLFRYLVQGGIPMFFFMSG